MRATGIVDVTPVLPAELQGLKDLAYNLRWTWHRSTQELFSQINEEVWDSSHDPLRVLRDTSTRRWAEVLHDADLTNAIRTECDGLENYLRNDAWYQDTHDESLAQRGSRDLLTAYFSMEFGITPTLPIYSGGLGVLAGDHLKSASDLGVPLIGVGLLYRFGYFSQTLSREGLQVENYGTHSPSDLAVTPVCDETGEQLTVTIRFPGKRMVNVALWEAKVGRVTLLLLDTNIPSNPADFQALTDRLYGGDEEYRICQEIILGVGGIRAVNAYCDLHGLSRPQVAHLNEGHAGFLGVERIRERMAEGQSFTAALAEVRASNVFTTHTPVPAGIDRFTMSLVRRYLNPDEQGNSKLAPGVPVSEVLALGNESDPGRFNMAHMGLRLAQRANGVAKLHGVVSRDMFSSLYPNFPAEESPIGSVTNGVHMPTWISATMEPLIARMSGGVDLATVDSWTDTGDVTTKELWEARSELRQKLVIAARAALRQSWLDRGASLAELGWVDDALDPDVLTVGFARRVSTYKRLTLMLQDVERLRRILGDDERPVQFVIAGKAHPADGGGKALLQQLVQFADRAGIRHRMVFLPDYDIELAQTIVSGCDIWLNNPIRPQEASGTSGMKAVMNGCLTLSVSDGWWDEMADDSLGWTIPSAEDLDYAVRDRLESIALYDLLERKAVPLFYDRDENGEPQGWIDMMRRSIVTLSPQVSATRMVRDYVSQYYRPAHEGALRMTADRGVVQEFVDWQQRVRDNWHHISVDQFECNGHSALAEEDGLSYCSSAAAGTAFEVRAQVSLVALSAEDVSVQAVVGELSEDGELSEVRYLPLHSQGEGHFAADLVVDTPGRLGIKVRVVPQHSLLVNPAELGLCCWK